MEDRGVLAIVFLCLRVLGIFVCASKAKELNRNQVGWGIFGFAMPIIAMIWIQFMKPVIKWEVKSE
ncbi:hypothetical protein [Halarcobacter sp.]|uniref:hypothetical protein n=1 Tax=Halarcobacter sp. TaxID=2321133 RepID=UPI003A8C97BE